MTTTPDFAVLVIHHNSADTALAMATQLAADGVPTSALVVVDNSDATAAAELAGGLNEGATVIRVPNHGYAAAVNRGVEALRDRGLPPESAVLVCTHELRFSPGAVPTLVSAVARDGVVAAGPVLTGYRGRADRVWSVGGELGRWGMVPRHPACGSPVGALATGRDPYPVTWLDGACVAYRLGTLLAEPLDERYFLYFEEVDLHLRIARQGQVVVVPEAVVQQETAGVPAYYLLRNYLLFTRGRVGWAQRLLGSVLVVGRWLPSVRRPADLVCLSRGLVDHVAGRTGPNRAT